MYRCHYASCKEKFAAKEQMFDHIEHCPYALQICPFCNTVKWRKNIHIEKHHCIRRLPTETEIKNIFEECFKDRVRAKPELYCDKDQVSLKREEYDPVSLKRREPSSDSNDSPSSETFVVENTTIKKLKCESTNASECSPARNRNKRTISSFSKSNLSTASTAAAQTVRCHSEQVEQKYMRYNVGLKACSVQNNLLTTIYEAAQSTGAQVLHIAYTGHIYVGLNKISDTIVCTILHAVSDWLKDPTISLVRIAQDFEFALVTIEHRKKLRTALATASAFV